MLFVKYVFVLSHVGRYCSVVFACDQIKILQLQKSNLVDVPSTHQVTFSF